MLRTSWMAVALGVIFLTGLVVFASDDEVKPGKQAARKSADDADPFVAEPKEPGPKKPISRKPATRAEQPQVKETPKAAAQEPLREMTRAEREKRIQEALKSPTECAFNECSLTDVLLYFKHRHKIEVQSDQNAMDHAGVTLESPVTKSLRNVSLRSALRLILKDLGLTYVIQDEVLLITSPEEASNKLKVVFYDITDLVVRQSEKGQWQEDTDGLVSAIVSSIQSKSWDEVGGPGSINVLSLPRRVALVVSQTDDVLEELEDFLAQARKVDASDAKQSSAKEPTEDQMRRRVIVPAGDPKAQGSGRNSAYPGGVKTGGETKDPKTSSTPAEKAK